MPFQFECMRQFAVPDVKGRQMPGMLHVNAINNNELCGGLKGFAEMPGLMFGVEGVGERSEGESL